MRTFCYCRNFFCISLVACLLLVSPLSARADWKEVHPADDSLYFDLGTWLIEDYLPANSPNQFALTNLITSPWGQVVGYRTNVRDYMWTSYSPRHSAKQNKNPLNPQDMRNMFRFSTQIRAGQIGSWGVVTHIERGQDGKVTGIRGLFFDSDDGEYYTITFQRQ